MGKSIPQQESYSTKTTKKGNLDFATLWNRTNVKIANELQRTMKAEKEKQEAAKLAVVKKQPSSYSNTTL